MGFARFALGVAMPPPATSNLLDESFPLRVSITLDRENPSHVKVLHEIPLRRSAGALHDYFLDKYSSLEGAPTLDLAGDAFIDFDDEKTAVYKNLDDLFAPRPTRIAEFSIQASPSWRGRASSITSCHYLLIKK
jgi:hypothetical protein